VHGADHRHVAAFGDLSHGAGNIVKTLPLVLAPMGRHTDNATALQPVA
jgi:hypothetical protein